MKGIGPRNLGMSKMSSGCPDCPDCQCDDSAVKFNDKLEAQAMKGNLPENFAKAVMANKNKSATPLKKKGCKGY